MKKKNKTIYKVLSILGLFAICVGVQYGIESLLSFGIVGANFAIGAPILANVRTLQRPMVSQDNPMVVHAAGSDYAYTTETAFREANTFIVPREITVNVSSNNGGGAVATLIYLFNNDTFGTVTDNTSGANSITYEWNDGYDGLIISRILSFGKQGMGIDTFGFTIEATNYTTLADYAAAVNQTQPTWMIADGQGHLVPASASAGGNNTKSAFKPNIAVIAQIKNVSCVTQHQLNILPNTTLALCYYTYPDFPRA